MLLADDPPVGISIEGASGSADSRKLQVSFIGALKSADEPCGADYATEAVESTLAVVVIDPEDARGWRNRGLMHLIDGRFKEGIADYDEAIKIEPDAVRLNNRGNALLELKRPEEALASYERVLQLEPLAANAFVARVTMVFAKSGDHVESVTVDGDSAEAVVVDQADRESRMGFVRNDGEWRIARVQ